MWSGLLARGSWLAVIKEKGAKAHIKGEPAQPASEAAPVVVAVGFGTVVRRILTIEHGDGAMVHGSRYKKYWGGSHESRQAVRTMSSLAAIKLEKTHVKGEITQSVAAVAPVCRGCGFWRSGEKNFEEEEWAWCRWRAEHDR